MGNPARSFDSLEYANELKQAGVGEELAQVQAKALFRVVNEQLLNKQDLEKVETKLSTDIEKGEAKLSADIKEVKGDIEKVESKLSGGIEKVESKLSSEIKEVKIELSADIRDVKRDVKESESRLFIRLGSLLGTLIVLVGGALGGMIEFLHIIHP